MSRPSTKGCSRACPCSPTAFTPIAASSNCQPPVYSQGISNDVKTWAVPTINPYYPTGAPGNLQVSYDFGNEIPPREPAYEISYRYHAGLNLDLPFSWSGVVYYSHSYETNFYLQNEVNGNAISAARWMEHVGGVTKPSAVCPI